MPDKQPLSALAEELLKREMAAHPEQFAPQPRPRVSSESRSISPDMLHTIGGLADAASTYAFLKRGTGREANPLVAALGQQRPALTGLVALGGLGLTKLAKHLIAKKSPRLADALAANLGAEQLALGVQNTANTFDLGGARLSSFDEYKNAMRRSSTREK